MPVVADGAAHRLLKLTDGGGAVTGWKLTTPSADVEMFDALGRLTSITTRAGFATALAYDTQGRLASVTDAFGRSLSFTYDAANRLETMTDPAARVYQYGYDATGRLSTVTYPDARTRTYVYENTQWLWALTGIIDERGTRYSTYGYDSFGRGMSTEHAGPENKYTISRSESPTQVQVNTSDAFSQAFSYTFAKVNGTLKLTQFFPQGTAGESRTYDANGNPASVTDARSMVTNYVYDATRNLESSRTEAYGTALARTITTTWHATFRLPATVTEPSGVAGVNQLTELTYDTSGNLTKKKIRQCPGIC